MRILGHVGLALATASVSWLGFIWQLVWLGRAGRLDGSATRVIGLSLLCSGIMATGLYLLLPLLNAALTSSVLILILLVLSGGAIYFVAGWLTGLLRLVFFSRTP
jgi:peptidoglycan biosynthesis protein MviN/MurJ (putative lipid II flippase)